MQSLVAPFLEASKEEFAKACRDAQLDYVENLPAALHLKKPAKGLGLLRAVCMVPHIGGWLVANYFSLGAELSHE